MAPRLKLIPMQSSNAEDLPRFQKRSSAAVARTSSFRAWELRRGAPQSCAWRCSSTFLLTAMSGAVDGAARGC